MKAVREYLVSHRDLNGPTIFQIAGNAQVDSLQKKINRASISLEDGRDLCAAVNEPPISEHSQSLLLVSINGRVNVDTKIVLQDYRNIHLYGSDAMWKILEGDSSPERKLAVLCRRVALLGGRC